MKSILWCTALLSAVATLGAQNPPPPPPPPTPPAPPVGPRPVQTIVPGVFAPIPLVHHTPTPLAPHAGHGMDEYTGFLFPPEHVMAHQRELNLQDAQREKLIKEMTTAQAQFTESQWNLSAEHEKLVQLVKGTTVDEGAVVKQMERILSMEQNLKRTQLLMMVRVKNLLTPEQQQILQRYRHIRVEPFPAPPAAGRRGGGGGADSTRVPNGILF
jgi:Spy/CpxP family protein refolding chaperone